MTYQTTKLIAAKQVILEEATLPEQVPAGHVRLTLAAASICGTDLHYYRHFANAGFELQNPITLGHEACAFVEDANGADLQTRQLVALNPIIFCGNCDNCARGEVNLCKAKKFPGSATTNPHIDGFFRPTFDFPAFCCHPVAPGTRPDHLTFAEPLACAMHAVNKGGISEGMKVLVTGCGPMGLLTIVAARARGAHVWATDIRPEAVEVAKSLGIERGFVGGSTDTSDMVGSFDGIIEASGSPHAFNLALDLVRRQGTISILANIQLTDTAIELHKIMLKEMNVIGSFQFNREFDEAVRFIESGAMDFERLTAARYPLAQTAQALDLMLSGQAAGKILLTR